MAVAKTRAEQVKEHLPPAVVLVARPVVRGALQALRFVRRMPKASTRYVRTLPKELFLRYRLTAWGPALFTAAARLRAPRDMQRRRRLARQYQADSAAVRVSKSIGYVLFQPAQLPGLDEVLRTCRVLFEMKTDERDRVARDADGKRGFLRNLLDNEDLVAHPELVDFALSDALLGAAAEYLGVIPHLTRIDLLYSVPRTGDTLEASQLFHLDPEGLTQAKVFVNVFDVNEDHGPFTFVPADISQRVVQQIRARRTEAGAPVVGRYTDEEVVGAGGVGSIVRVTGPAGGGVIVDTSRCLHCGSRVRPGAFRLCLYIQYCTSREQGNVFDLARFAGDPVRSLALTHSRKSAGARVTAPHQM